MKTLKKLMPLLLLLVGSLAHAQYSSDFTCSIENEGFVWFNNTDNLEKYCSATTVIPFATQAWVTSNFAIAKPSATGSLTNSALGCATTTITLTGVAVGDNIQPSFYGSTAVPAGLVINAQVTAANTVTVNECAVLTLSIASRNFIVTKL